MILSEEVEITIINNNKKYFLDKGYDVSGDKLLVRVSDLTIGSKVNIMAICDICGKSKCISYYNYNKSLKKGGFYSCSSKCSNIKKKNTNLIKYGKEWASQSDDIKEKIVENNITKYGVSCVFELDEIKSKITKTNLIKYGKEWASQSDVVKKKTIETNNNRYNGHPSKSDEIKNKNKITNLDRYGFNNPMKNDDIYRKSLETKLERYGDAGYNNREKFHITNMDRFGKYYTQTEEYKEKTINTNLEKWGVEWASQSDIIKNKVKKTKLERYGDTGYNNISKSRETNIIKYGYDSPLKNSLIRNKIESTNFSRYGVKNYIELEHVIKKRIDSFDLRNKEYAISVYSNIIPNKYKILNYFSGDFTIRHGDHEFISSLRLVYDRLKYSNNCEICTICNPISSNSSSHENEIYDWLISIGVEVEKGNRTILNGYEIDLFIPSKKIAIEFNGLYWHSELFKDKYYHRKKTDDCNEKGIDLIHIWEDDWINKKEIIKSIIRNRLHITTDKISARNCIVRYLTLKECKKFLEENHIQGHSRSKYKLGLIYKNEIVSVMTLGIRKTNSFSEFELIRFCNKKNTNVIGSASKLLKHFVKDNKYIGKIVSYADVSLFSGSLYYKLGFSIKKISGPNYYWVVDNVRHHRFKYNKKKLIKFYSVNPNKTEYEIMHERGHYRIWSCGQIRYEIVF